MLHLSLFRSNNDFILNCLYRFLIRAACARVTGAVITGKSRDYLIAKLPLTLVSLENKVNAGR